MDIPEDVMEAAGGVLRDFMHSPKKGKLTHIIARAIMAERERTQKAERERCAQIARDFGKSANGKFNGCVSDHAKGTRNLEYAAACAVGMCSAAEHIATLLEAHHA